MQWEDDPFASHATHQELLQCVDNFDTKQTFLIESVLPWGDTDKPLLASAPWLADKRITPVVRWVAVEVTDAHVYELFERLHGRTVQELLLEFCKDFTPRMDLIRDFMKKCFTTKLTTIKSTFAVTIEELLLCLELTPTLRSADFRKVVVRSELEFSVPLSHIHELTLDIRVKQGSARRFYAKLFACFPKLTSLTVAEPDFPLDMVYALCESPFIQQLTDLKVDSKRHDSIITVRAFECLAQAAQSLVTVEFVHATIFSHVFTTIIDLFLGLFTVKKFSTCGTIVHGLYKPWSFLMRNSLLEEVSVHASIPKLAKDSFGQLFERLVNMPRVKHLAWNVVIPDVTITFSTLSYLPVVKTLTSLSIQQAELARGNEIGLIDLISECTSLERVKVVANFDVVERVNRITSPIRALSIIDTGVQANTRYFFDALAHPEFVASLSLKQTSSAAIVANLGHCMTAVEKLKIIFSQSTVVDTVCLADFIAHMRVLRTVQFLSEANFTNRVALWRSFALIPSLMDVEVNIHSVDDMIGEERKAYIEAAEKTQISYFTTYTHGDEECVRRVNMACARNRHNELQRSQPLIERLLWALGKDWPAARRRD